MNLLTSEWLKTKHTIIRWLIFFMPVCISSCIIAYLSYRSDLSFDSVYEGFFMIWTTIIIPIGVSVLTSFLVYEEELAGDFNSLLNTGISRIKLYAGKICFSVLSLTVCTFITTLILCIGMNILFPSSINISLFLMSSILAIIGTLPILAIHLWVSFLWGMGASIGLGICGILMAVLIGTTGLGVKIWMIIPWSYPVKMAMFSVAYSLLPSTMMVGTTMQLILELALSITFFVIFLLGGVIWFRKWEGRKSSE